MANSESELERTVGHYEVMSLPLNLTDKIDEGSSAHIYHYTLRNKAAAVKVFKSNIPAQKLLRIAAKLKELRHENVVRFRGYSSRPSAIFFEFCATPIGEDIAHNLCQLTAVLNSRGNFNLKQRLGYLSQALQGLNYLHSKNIVHQDFKPSNLLVHGNSAEDVTVKITDFDDIMLVKQTIKATFTGNHLKGMTLCYTAPELCLCLIKKATKLSDIYSFAITCFESLIDGSSAWLGALPIVNDTILINALSKQKRPELDTIKDLYDDKRNLTSLVCDMLQNCWQDDYMKRPNTEEVCWLFLRKFIPNISIK